MMRAPKLPVLPGYSFNREIGQTRFHKSTQFELIHGVLPYITEADRPGTGGYPFQWATPDLYPSFYPRRETKELPAWIAFDKQILTFEAYFQQAEWEVYQEPFQIRKVKILYFLEDGTIQVNEPRVQNSGMNQGTLISRQRIRFPKPMDANFYEAIDFNIGKNVELYGKVFRIVNCDNFTRQFLNRMGIFVGDPLNYPEDPHFIKEEKKKDEILARKPRKSAPELGKFLKFDKCVLRFDGYWDDRSTMYGTVHKLEIYYFLADDTIEIKEQMKPNAGTDFGSMFLKRGRLPKYFDRLPGLGDNDTMPLLNVLSTGYLKGRYVVDPISSGAAKLSYYKDNDLLIGTYLNVYGRKVVLTDCDGYTKEYYRAKYGVDTFTKLPTPDESDVVVVKEIEIPPWNGFGSYEDSEMNCRKIVPEMPKKSFYKILVKGRVGLDSHILRFTAKMLSPDSVNDDRVFLVSYFLSTDTVSVYERGIRNSGFASQLFLRQREIFKPDQEMFVSKKPETYQREDFWVGNRIKLEGFIFVLTAADDYCFRYMELNCREFPKSNINLILDKIREKMRPVYKEFVSKHFKPCVDGSEELILPYDQVKHALIELLGNDITEHEIITVARYFTASKSRKTRTKDEMRCVSVEECKKRLWFGLDRLRENLMYKDPLCTGYVSSKDAYSLCKGAKVPIDTYFLDTIFEIVQRNECGEVSICDLLSFFGDGDILFQPRPPFSHTKEFSDFYKYSERTIYKCVDCGCLLKQLGLEEGLTKNVDCGVGNPALLPPPSNSPRQ